MFAGQSGTAEEMANTLCLQGEGAWWVGTDLPLDAARDAALACGGLIHIHLDGMLVPDRGWGDSPAAGTGPDPSGFVLMPAAELVRTAGLTQMAPAAATRVVVLLPGAQVGGLIRRALDLGLQTSYQQVQLRPLFTAGPARPAFAVTLETLSEHLPVHLIAALERDPFTLVCRRVSDRLLVQHQRESPLPDLALDALVDEGVWILAADGHGCSRLVARGPAQSGSAFVRLDQDHPLTDPAEGTWPDSLPEPPVLAVVPARTRGQKVDAILLSDEALRCLPVLLEGSSMAGIAQLVLGRDRHLLTAPGGLLEDLPVGEPLYCLGPGQLYLPLGYRLRPLLPASARRVLLPAENGRATVLTTGAWMTFDLGTRIPVWELWAGPVPEVDSQLPEGGQQDLERLDRELSPAEDARPRPRFLAPAFGRGPRAERSLLRPSARARDWRERAYSLELRGFLTEAAEIHMRNNQPLQAARLFERAAEEDDGGRGTGRTQRST